MPAAVRRAHPRPATSHEGSPSGQGSSCSSLTKLSLTTLLCFYPAHLFAKSVFQVPMHRKAPTFILGTHAHSDYTHLFSDLYTCEKDLFVCFFFKLDSK